MYEKYFTSTVEVSGLNQTLPESSDKASILAYLLGGGANNEKGSIFYHMLSKGQAFARPAGDNSTYLYKLVSENDFVWPDVLDPTDIAGPYGKASWDHRDGEVEVAKRVNYIELLDKQIVGLQAELDKTRATKFTEENLKEKAITKRDAAKTLLDAME